MLNTSTYLPTYLPNYLPTYLPTNLGISLDVSSYLSQCPIRIHPYTSATIITPSLSLPANVSSLIKSNQGLLETNRTSDPLQWEFYAIIILYKKYVYLINSLVRYYLTTIHMIIKLFVSFLIMMGDMLC